LWYRCRFDKRRKEDFYDEEQAAAFTPSLGLGISKLLIVFILHCPHSLATAAAIDPYLLPTGANLQ